MGMVVRTNTMAINANRQLSSNNNQVAKSLEKLSSGFRINRAGDDASGLAISEKMKAQIKGLEQASANAQDGISLIQTAEGNLAEVHDMLNRMVELAEKSANGILEAEDRASLQEEMNALADEIDRIADSANFNNLKLFDGTMSQEKGVTVTKPTNMNYSIKEGTTSTAAQITIDLAGIEVDKAGLLTFDIGGKEYNVNVTDDMLKDSNKVANKIATALQTAMDTAANPLKQVDKAGTGFVTFTPNVDTGATTLVLTSSANGTLAETLKNPNQFAGKFTVKAADADAMAGSITNSLMTVTAGVDNTKEAKYTVDMTGVKLNEAGVKSTTTEAGIATFEIFGKSYEIEIEKGEKAADITKALATAINSDKPKDSAAGEFTAKADGVTLELTSANKKAVADDAFKNAYAISIKGETNVAPNGLKLQIGDSNYDYDKLIVSMDDMHMDALFDGVALNDKAYKKMPPDDIKNKLGTGVAVLGESETDFTDSKGNESTSQINTTVGDNALNISTQDNAGAALKAIRNVIGKVSTQRGKLGAIQNRLEHTINNLDTAYENMTAANSRIRDTDMAKEMMNYTKMNVLVQSAQAMLAQANQQPQSILQLLQ